MERGMIMKALRSVVVERGGEGPGTGAAVTFAEAAKGVRGEGKLEVVISREGKDSEDIRKDVLGMDPRAVDVSGEHGKDKKGFSGGSESEGGCG